MPNPARPVTVIFNRPVVPLTNLDAQKDFPQPVTLIGQRRDGGGHGRMAQHLDLCVQARAAAARRHDHHREGRGATRWPSLVDTDNNPLAADYTWQFAVVPPKVVYITPGNGAAQVPIESPIVVQFNQPISLDSAREHVTLTASDGKNVPLNFDVLSETLTMTPTTRLDFETAYVIKIAAGLTGRSGGSGMRETVQRVVHDRAAAQGRRTLIPRTANVTRRRTPSSRSASTRRSNHDTVHGASDVQSAAVADAGATPTATARSFGINFGAQPSTDYEVKIAPGIKDPYGNETKEALTVRFHTADLEPSVRLHMPNFVGTYNAYDPASVYVITPTSKRST